MGSATAGTDASAKAAMPAMERWRLMAAIARTSLLRGRYRCCRGKHGMWWQSLTRQLCGYLSVALGPGTCPLAGLGVSWRSTAR